MATITEDYVSFEIAKHLKEKGFDEPCYAYWCEDENKIINSQSPHAIKNISNPCFFGPAAPTIQMAMKWLREVHKKWITITFHWHTVDGGTTLYYSPCIMLSEYENVVLEDKNPFKMKLFNSYEEACEAAIKYCLENLI